MNKLNWTHVKSHFTVRFIILVLIRFRASYLGRRENIFSGLNVLYFNFDQFFVVLN